VLGFSEFSQSLINLKFACLGSENVSNYSTTATLLSFHTIKPNTPLTYLLNYPVPKYIRNQRILT